MPSATRRRAVPPIKVVAVMRRISARQFSRVTRISYGDVDDVWNGRRLPSPSFVAKAVKFFDLPAESLFGEIER